MTSVFVSYRRDDSAGHAGRLFDDLVDVYGRERLFRDIDSIRPGDDFTQVLERQLTACRVLLAVIGPRWLEAAEAGRPRLHDPDDYVRMELAAALGREDVRVLPVYVHDAEAPAPETLPEEVRPLAFRQGIELRDSRWNDDVQHLVEIIGRPGGMRRMLTRPVAWAAAAAAVLAVALAAWQLLPEGSDSTPSVAAPSPAAERSPNPATSAAAAVGAPPAPPASAPAGEASPTPSAAPESHAINFQAAGAPTPDGFLADYGQPFGEPTTRDQPSSLRYGWVRPGTSQPLDMTAHARDRGFSPDVDQELDTLMHFRNHNPASGEIDHGSWELAVPPGRYSVTVMVGDPNPRGLAGRARQRHTVAVEGVPAITDFSTLESGMEHESNTVTVQVDDGRLTLASPDDLSTKINWVRVVPLP